MTLEIPLWSAGPEGMEFEHPALLDRRLVDAIFPVGGGVLRHRDQEALMVKPRAAGANMTVDIRPGMCVIPGISVGNQGSYVCRSTAIENRSVAAAPGSGHRNDLVVARVRDSTVTGSQDGFFIDILNGTTTVPDDAIPLARIRVNSTDTAVTEAMITDLRRSASLTRGWTDIDEDVLGTDASSFTIPVTPRAYSMLRFTIRGRLSGNSKFGIRVNNDTTSNLHASNQVIKRSSDGAIVGTHHSASTLWRMGHWATGNASLMIATIMWTDSSSINGWESVFTRIGASGTTSWTGKGWGRLNSSRVVSSLRVATENFAEMFRGPNTRWWLEGYQVEPEPGTVDPIGDD